MCKLMEEAMSRNDEMTERRLFDRRAADIAAKSQRGEITALTTECKNLAAKLASAQAVPVASVGDDPEFRVMARHWADTRHLVGSTGWAGLVAYIDSRATPASAPSGETLKETFSKAFHYPECWDTVAYPDLSAALVEVYEHYHCTQCAAPQPVAAAQAVPELSAQSRKLIERALIGLRDGWLERGDADAALAVLASTSPAAPKDAQGAVPDVKAMVNRFLGWKLPKDFCPDAGVSFNRDYVEKWGGYPQGYPVGTNLLTADQAKAMFEYCLAAAPVAQPTDTTKGA